MGVLNLTPDSFSDGGAIAPDAVAARLRELVAAGADLIDVGAESTRPGAAAAVCAADQLARLAPLLQVLDQVAVPVSVDTRDAAVARAAFAAGVEVVNDVSGGAQDPDMAAVVADAGAVAIVMHMRGTPATMDARAVYGDVVREVRDEWQRAAARFLAAGVPSARVWMDPGLGFAKTSAQSWRLLRAVLEFKELNVPLVVGPSRKRFVDVIGLPAPARDPATHAAVVLAALAGADVVRVHDVAGARQAVGVADLWREA